MANHIGNAIDSISSFKSENVRWLESVTVPAVDDPEMDCPWVSLAHPDDEPHLKLFEQVKNLPIQHEERAQ